MSIWTVQQKYLCLRGSRTKWRSGGGMDDGAGLPAELPKLTFISFPCSVILLFMYMHYLYVIFMIVFIAKVQHLGF